MGLYHTTRPWSSRASSPVTHALAVVLNRPTVRLLGVCLPLLLLSCSLLVCRFFRFSLRCCTLGCTYQYAFTSTSPARTAGKRLFVTHRLHITFVTPSRKSREEPPNPHPNPDPIHHIYPCLLYTSPSPRDKRQSRMPSSA